MTLETRAHVFHDAEQASKRTAYIIRTLFDVTDEGHYVVSETDSLLDQLIDARHVERELWDAVAHVQETAGEL